MPFLCEAESGASQTEEEQKTCSMGMLLSRETRVIQAPLWFIGYSEAPEESIENTGATGIPRSVEKVGYT